MQTEVLSPEKKREKGQEVVRMACTVGTVGCNNVWTVYLVKRWITRQGKGVLSIIEGTCNAEMDDLERHGDDRAERQHRGLTRDELIRMAEKAQWRQRSEFMAQPAVQLGCDHV